MNQKAPVLSRLRRWLRQTGRNTDPLWMILFLIAALVLCWSNLGEVPLRDWDEGLVAQVAREISRASFADLNWIYPTLWGQPYLNKPPLMHGLVAIAYTLGGEPTEWASRFPGATLTALSIPLFYCLSRELFHRRTTAIIATCVYLTSLPVVRLGRLAMLDGAILCFLILMMWCVVRSRRDSRFALGIGIAFGLIGLTKGVMVAVLFGAIALIFLRWDTPRLLSSPYLWLGIALGSAPLAVWYGAQWIRYQEAFLGENLVTQSFSRIWASVENNGAPPWYYLFEILKYGFPWVLFLPLGLRFAWTNRLWSWSRLALVWTGIYFLAISLMVTKLPWYSLPLYPAMALVVGPLLTELWDNGIHPGVRQTPSPYSRGWTTLFVFLTLISGIGFIYFSKFVAQPDVDLQLILASVSMSMLATTLLIAQQNGQFLSVLIWGTYVSLLLLILSPHWLWELNEAYPVKPVAELIRASVPPNRSVFTSYPYHRPSLNFYSEHRVVPTSPNTLLNQWVQQARPYFLLDDSALRALPLESCKRLGQAEGWTLVTRTRKPSEATCLPVPGTTIEVKAPAL